VVPEALHGVSHRDEGHHQQPAAQRVQKATHCFSLRDAPVEGEEVIVLFSAG